MGTFEQDLHDRIEQIESPEHRASEVFTTPRAVLTQSLVMVAVCVVVTALVALVRIG